MLGRHALNKQILTVSWVSDCSKTALKRIINLFIFRIFFRANRGFLSSLIVTLCDWELFQVVLRETNEELTGKNIQRKRNAAGEREMKSDT